MQPLILKETTEKILQVPYSGLRRLVAIAGPPASGKSTLAKQLVNALNNAGEVSFLIFDRAKDAVVSVSVSWTRNVPLFS